MTLYRKDENASTAAGSTMQNVPLPGFDGSTWRYTSTFSSGGESSLHELYVNGQRTEYTFETQGGSDSNVHIVRSDGSILDQTEVSSNYRKVVLAAPGYDITTSSYDRRTWTKQTDDDPGESVSSSPLSTFHSNNPGDVPPSDQPSALDTAVNVVKSGGRYLSEILSEIGGSAYGYLRDRASAFVDGLDEMGQDAAAHFDRYGPAGVAVKAGKDAKDMLFGVLKMARDLPANLCNIGDGFLKDPVQMTGKAIGETAWSLPQILAVIIGGRALTRPQQRAIQKIDNIIKDHLKPGPRGDIAGTVSDMVGNPIKKPGGGFFDHVAEMNDTIRGLRNHAKTLKGATDPAAIAARQRALDALKAIEDATRGAGL